MTDESRSDAAQPHTLLRRIRHALQRTAKHTAWYVNGLTGQSKYAAYLAHHQTTHPDTPPLSEREFWRDHYAAQDANPGARCC